MKKDKTMSFKEALEFVQSSIKKSNCPLCKRELGILIADIKHNKDLIVFIIG